MDLEELLSKIESEETKEAVVSAVEAEKQKGIESYNKKDRETLKFKNALKELGYDSTKHGDIESFVQSTKTLNQKASSSEVTIAELQERLATVEGNLEAERQLLQQKEAEAKVSKIKAELTTKIGDMFYGSKYLIESLSSQCEVVDGKVVYKKDEATKVSLKDAIPLIKEANKDMLKVKIARGSNTDKGVSNVADEDKTMADAIKKKLNLI